MFQNKTIMWLLFIFIFLNVCDIVTTIFILEGESNPIYHLFGNIYIVFLLKIFIIILMWIFAKRNLYSNNITYFMIICVILYGCLALLIAQVINIYGILHPVTIQQASNLLPAQRVTFYYNFMGLVYIIPLAFSLIAFKLYDMSCKYVIVNKELAEKNKWNLWKIVQ